MRRSTTVLVASLLVLVNVGALWFLGRHIQAPLPAASTSSTPTPSATPTSSDAVTGPLWLAADPAGNVLRITTGSCSAEPARAWFAPGPSGSATPVTIEGLQRLLGLRRVATGWEVIGADAACRVVAWRGGPLAREWTKVEVPADAYHLIPDDLTKVMTPRGVVPLENCRAQQLAVTADGQAYVVCSGTVLLVSGRTPASVSALTAVAAVAARPATATQSPLAFLSGDAQCPSLLTTVSPQNGRESSECLSRDKAGLGLAWTGASLVAQVGSDLMAQGDRSWSVR